MIKWFIDGGLEILHFPISKTKACYSFLTIAATFTSPEDHEAHCARATSGLLSCLHAMLMIFVMFGVLKRNDQPHTFNGEVSTISYMMLPYI